MEALLDLTVKSTLLLACASVVALALGRASAASRHLVWTSVFCAIALLPIARVSLPALRIPILRPMPMAVAAAAVIELPQGSVAPVLPAYVVPAAAATEAPAEPATTRNAASTPRRSITLAQILFAIWIGGAILLAARRVGHSISLRRAIVRAEPVFDSQVLARLNRAARDFGVRRPIGLLKQPGDGLPCTFGVRRPTILLPGTYLGSSSLDNSLDLILVHEVAHIARLDVVADRISQVAVMMFWFNPLMWAAARQARLERERAADDAVLASGARPSDYANGLLSIARSQSLQFVSSTLPMAASGLERRVRAILDAGARRGRRSSSSVVFAMALLAAMLPVSAARLVARAAALPAPLAPVHASSLAPGRTDVSRPALAVEQSDPLAVWNTEGLRNLRQVLRLAREAREEALTKVAIGTTAPGDVAVLETTVARLEEAVKNFTPSTTPLTPQELKARRAAFAGALRYLEAAGRRFTNGVLTTTELASALLRAAQVTDPSIQAPVTPAAYSAGHTSPFTFLPTPAAASTDGIGAQQGQGQQGPQRQNQQGQGQQGQGQQSQTTMPTTRVAMMKILLEHAQRAWKDALTKVEIGTAAPIDTVTFETTVAQIEQMYLAAQVAEQQANQSRAPQQMSATELAAAQTRMATALSSLNVAEIRFANGIITNNELSDALKAAATAAAGLPIMPSSQASASPADAMFTSTNFPGSTTADRNSARALYDLLTGRVATISGNSTSQSSLPVATDAEILAALQSSDKIKSESDRADSLIAVAQRYQLTPDMVSAYVAAANSIKNDADRARVFAQPIRVKSPGKTPQYYWQR